ncbi:hypothetical protein MKW98_022882, partial [Papaver atlanticum]
MKFARKHEITKVFMGCNNDGISHAIKFNLVSTGHIKFQLPTYCRSFQGRLDEV